MSPGSYFILMVCTTSHGIHYASNRGQHLSKFYTSSHSGCSGSPVSRRSHCMSYVKISPVLDVLCPQSAHLTTMACVSSHSMCNVSPVSPGGHHTSTSCTSSHAGPSGAPVSPGSHYMNHAEIYPFSDVTCPQWALGGTLYQWHIHLAIRCTTCPYWAPGATRLQHPLHLAVSDVPGPLWAIGATIWITPRSIHFQTCNVPNEPWEPLHINVIYI